MSESAPESQRFRIDLAYDGTLFHGWAAQPGLRTVQGELEEVLSTVFRQRLTLTVAGRTDAGVHATGQVAHFDVPFPLPDKPLPSLAAGALTRLTSRLNGLLASRYSRLLRPVADRPDMAAGLLVKGESDLTLGSIIPVSHDFDARFSALSRTYQYVLADGSSRLDPLARASQWWSGGAPLNLAAMQEAAATLVGEHDFLSFCRPREGATTIRTLRLLHLERDSEGCVRIDVSADAFCHSMVRSLVGALVEVGRGRRPVDWPAFALEEPSRQHGVPVAPARGLTLVRVAYPNEDEWGRRAAQARNRRC